MVEKQQKLFIKNMVCHRCIMTVESIFNKLEIPFKQVSLGEVELESKLSQDELKKIERDLNHAGFELIETRVNKVIEDIKQATMEYLNLGMDNENIRLSSFITKK